MIVIKVKQIVWIHQLEKELNYVEATIYCFVLHTSPWNIKSLWNSRKQITGFVKNAFPLATIYSLQ